MRSNLPEVVSLTRNPDHAAMAHRGIAIITGGCGGLGLAFAERWLRTGGQGRFVTRTEELSCQSDAHDEPSTGSECERPTLRNTLACGDNTRIPDSGLAAEYYDEAPLLRDGYGAVPESNRSLADEAQAPALAYSPHNVMEFVESGEEASRIQPRVAEALHCLQQQHAHPAQRVEPYIATI